MTKPQARTQPTTRLDQHFNPTLALQQRVRFWRRVRRLTLALLLVWAAVAVLVPWFARDLSAFTLGGFPLGYWLSAQGAILVFMAIILAYALVMDRWDAAFRAAQFADQSSEQGHRRA